MVELEFRSATPEDADAVAAYHDRCLRNTYAAQLLAGEFGVPDLEGTRQQLHAWFERRSGLDSLLAVLDGSPIAHVTVSGHQLVHLFVAPAHQGTGIGRRLLATGEAMMAANGHTDLELHARVEDVAAIAFYERHGWTVTNRLIHTVEHGISYDEHVLRKQSRVGSPLRNGPTRPIRKARGRSGAARVIDRRTAARDRRRAGATPGDACRSS